MDLKVNGIRLVENDRLNFNIYHGTSSRNLNSIRKHGFGYKDPELFDRNLLIKLAKEVEKHWTASELWQGHEYIINKMIDNSGRFTYDNMHFSPSRNTALNYANDFEGSEYLFTINMLVEELNRLEKGKGNEIVSNNHKFRDYIKTPHSPILVIWQKPLLSELGTEGDLSLTGVKNQIKHMADFDIFPTFEENALVCWQQMIFVSKEVLPYQKIKIEKIEERIQTFDNTI